MAKILAPKNQLNFIKCRKILTESEYEQFRVFIHFLTLKGFYQEHTINRQPVEILHSILCKKIFNRKTCSKILRSAELMDAVFIEHSYKVGEKAKTYRLNFLGKPEVECYDYDFIYMKNKEKFELLFQCNPKVYSEPFEASNDSIQRDFISKLEFDKASFNIVLKQLINSKKAKGKMGIYYLNHLAIVQSECYAFDQLRGYSFYDNFSGRYYSFMTNKSAAIRNCFKLDGNELSTLDIKSSQVYFLTQLPNLNLDNYKVDKTKILIDESFRNEVLQGDIYQYFGNKLGISRDNAKIKFLSFIYGNKKYTNIKRILKTDFPLTAQTLEYLMSIQVNDTKYCYSEFVYGVEVKKNNYLNYILQSVERNIFLKSLEGFESYFTVHDSVYFLKGREAEFRTKILSHFSCKKLDLPKLA